MTRFFKSNLGRLFWCAWCIITLTSPVGRGTFTQMSPCTSNNLKQIFHESVDVLLHGQNDDNVPILFFTQCTLILLTFSSYQSVCHWTLVKQQSINTDWLAMPWNLIVSDEAYTIILCHAYTYLLRLPLKGCKPGIRFISMCVTLYQVKVFG